MNLHTCDLANLHSSLFKTLCGSAIPAGVGRGQHGAKNLGKLSAKQCTVASPKGCHRDGRFLLSISQTKRICKDVTISRNLWESSTFSTPPVPLGKVGGGALLTIGSNCKSLAIVQAMILDTSNVMRETFTFTTAGGDLT